MKDILLLWDCPTTEKGLIIFYLEKTDEDQDAL